MTGPEPRQPDAAMTRYVAERLPRSAHARGVRSGISERYSRFYAPLALASIVITFLPIFNDVEFDQGSSTPRNTYGTVFEMAARPGGGPAVTGVVLLVALVALLTIAAFGTPPVGVPVAIAFVATLIAVMLIAKPGTGSPTPDLSDAGRAGLAIAICATVVGLTHAIHLALAKEE